MSDQFIEEVIDEAETESSQDESKDIVYSISSFGSDIPVDTIISRLDRGVIFVPNFQRNYVWKKVQASQFIESILLGLPVPGVFFYRESETEKFLVVDGLQRLLTLHGFIKGRFPPARDGFVAESATAKSAPKADVFTLEKVQKRFAGRAFVDLDPVDQRRIENYVIHATNIEQDLPEGDVSSVYFIFQRINTGGTPLQPQEIRSALFHGDFNALLEHLNENVSWRDIFGARHKRRKDEELILRFLALSSAKYNAPMAGFLNDFMESKRMISKPEGLLLEQAFTTTIEFVYASVGKRAFRLRSGTALNAAVFDAVMVAAYTTNAVNRLMPEDFAKRYDGLLENEKFQIAVGRATAREEQVADRMRVAVEAFSDAPAS